MTTRREWPWNQFPDKHSTWESCLAAYDALMEAQYVPGQYKCAICGLSLSDNAMNPSTGEVGARVDPLPKGCPNKCGLLDRMTWKELSEQGHESTETLLAREDVLRVSARELIKALMADPEMARGKGMLMANVEMVTTAMGAKLSDDLVRIVHEYWEHRYAGADSKTLRVVEA